MVMVTAFEHNLLALAVLGDGRRLNALVGDDGAAKATAEKAVDAACTKAMGRGWFRELRQADKIVGGKLPAKFPTNNISQALNEEMARSMETFDDDDDGMDVDAAAWLEVARRMAGEFNIEIRVRTKTSGSMSVYYARVIA